MNRLLVPILFLIFGLLTPAAYGQVVANPIVGGIPVYCSLSNGATVYTAYAAMNDIAQARYASDGLPLIVLNPHGFGSLPDAVQRFIYAHECMHHLLGHVAYPLNMSREIEADCEAMKLLRDQDLITGTDAQMVGYYFRNNPPLPPFYPPGSERAARVLACYEADS